MTKIMFTKNCCTIDFTNFDLIIEDRKFFRYLSLSYSKECRRSVLNLFAASKKSYHWIKFEKRPDKTALPASFQQSPVNLSFSPIFPRFASKTKDNLISQILSGEHERFNVILFKLLSSFELVNYLDCGRLLAKIGTSKKPERGIVF